MLDTHLYLLTEDNPSGPLLSTEDSAVEGEGLSRGQPGSFLGEILAVIMVLAVGIYAAIAI